MRKICDNSLIVIAVAMFLFISGCKESVPDITTNKVTNITSTTAESGGEITSDGRSRIINYGICWDTVGNPTTESYRQSDSIAKEKFVIKISDLFPNKTYYVRAYAVNKAGTAYGEQVSFTTPPSVPLLKTSAVTDISAKSARSGGVIYSDGGYPVLNAGVCWDTASNPTASGTRTIDTIGIADFTSEINGLKNDKSYFVRAYATNSLGTGYGNEIEFKTTRSAPIVTITSVTEKYLFSASCSISLKSADNIIEYGICWNTKPGPTTDNSKNSKPYARGKFRMRDLKPGTTYFVRAYLINGNGTFYGNSKSFKTLGSRPKVRTLDASDLTTSGANVKASVNAGSLPTVVSFEYGTDDKYGQTVKLSGPPVKGKADTIVTAKLSGLMPGTTYHFRAKATNAIGTTPGKDVTLLILKIPNITGFLPVTRNYRDSSFFITQPASDSPGAFSYSSSNPGVAVIKGNKVIITGSGTSTITATQAASGVFAAGSVSTSFTMNLVDIDGNVYHTVAIGGQDWMKENLKVTRFRNGAPIPEINDNAEWAALTGAAFCRINNDTLNRFDNYGALYNWYAVADSRKICPAGWHVPTDAEWQVMERYLGMSFTEAEETVLRGANQGLQLKDTTGWIKNGNGTNSSDFSALPAGLRVATTGLFYNTGIDACWWTSTEEDANKAWLRNMYYFFNSIYRIPDLKNFGFSVRCVRDKK
jgi:uncharacterized protein (TIGR02145 family)